MPNPFEKDSIKYVQTKPVNIIMLHINKPQVDLIMLHVDKNKSHVDLIRLHVVINKSQVGGGGVRSMPPNTPNTIIHISV